MSTPLTEKAAEELWRDCIAKGSASLLSYRVTKLLVSVDRAARSEDSQDMGALAVLRTTAEALRHRVREHDNDERSRAYISGRAQRGALAFVECGCVACATDRVALAKADALLSRSGVRPSAPAPSCRPRSTAPDMCDTHNTYWWQHQQPMVPSLRRGIGHVLNEGHDKATCLDCWAAPLLSALRPIAAAYPDDPGTSDLDDEQPVTIKLGDVRRARAALKNLEGVGR